MWVDGSLGKNLQAYVTYTLSAPISFDKIRLGTGSGLKQGDPVRWKLEGREQGPYAEWEVIHCQQADLPPPDERRTWMDWIEVERDASSGKPTASLKTCA